MKNKVIILLVMLQIPALLMGQNFTFKPQTSVGGYGELHYDQQFSGMIVSYWTVSRNDTIVGFAAMDIFQLRNQQPRVLVLFTPQTSVNSIRIFGFHGIYGRGATTQTWLKHFKGKTANSDFSYADGVPAISGATETAHGIRKAVKRLTMLTKWMMNSSHTQIAGRQ
ncbi:FMN-binding protein [bacterium]|nr:FMN-binding protein [bacterium]